MDHMTIRPHDLHPQPHLHTSIRTCSHTPCCKTLKHHSVITAINGDDGVLMSTLTSATSLGSQLADNYDSPQYYHNDSSTSRANTKC